MSKVRKETTSLEYKNGGFLNHIDFYDTFSTINLANNLQEITEPIFNMPPKWIAWLFNIRNRLVSLIGLKTGVPADYNECFSVGECIGFFQIFSISESQLVLGADDSHLNFRAIIANTNETLFNIKVTTLVQYNNSKGKFYMSMIKPFHEVIVKTMVKNAYKSIKFPKKIINTNLHCLKRIFQTLCLGLVFRFEIIHQH